MPGHNAQVRPRFSGGGRIGRTCNTGRSHQRSNVGVDSRKAVGRATGREVDDGGAGDESIAPSTRGPRETRERRRRSEAEVVECHRGHRNPRASGHVPCAVALDNVRHPLAPPAGQFGRTRWWAIREAREAAKQT